MNTYKYINLRQNPQLKEQAVAWFHSKLGVPKEAYGECMAGNFCVWFRKRSILI